MVIASPLQGEGRGFKSHSSYQKPKKERKMNEKDIILIYNQIPDNLSIYKFSDVSPEVREKLTKCHNKIGNTVVVENDEELNEIVNNWLPEFLATREECCVFSDDEEKHGDKYKNPYNINDPVIIIVSGFYM